MSDKVVVNTSDINDLPFVEQEHSGDKYVLLEDIKHWLEDATPVSGEAVGYVDEFGNFEKDLKPWMKDEPNVIRKAVYTTPQPAPDGYALVPLKVTPAIEAIYGNEKCVYQTAQDMHDAMIAEAIKGE